MELPDCVYNWLIDFFRAHTHCSRFSGIESEFIVISASIIQGSAAGPASYVVTGSDLRPLTTGNSMIKFADDTYLVIPASKKYNMLLYVILVLSHCIAQNRLVLRAVLIILLSNVSLYQVNQVYWIMLLFCIGDFHALLPASVNINGQKLNFLNDLDISKDGYIYFSDSSKFQRRDFSRDLLSGRGTGR